MWLLVIGLAWLSVTAIACLLIARAIRSADAREEELALLSRSAKATVTGARGASPKLSGRRVIMPPVDDEGRPEARRRQRPDGDVS
jgi:hypothetical protein